MEDSPITIEHVNVTDPENHEPKGVAAAAVNLVYVSDGAGSGTWQQVDEDQINSGAATLGQPLLADGSGGVAFGDEPGAVHGEMRVVGNSTATTIGSSATYVKVAEGTPTGSHLNGITFSVDHLIIPSDGVYVIEANLSFEGSSGDIFKFDLAVSSGLTPLEHASRRKTPNADVGAVTVGGLHSLSTNDEIYLIVQNEAGTNNPTITDWNLFAHKLSE